MKSLAHLAGFSLALALAALGSGCSSTSATSTYRQPAQDFEVVEASTQRPLADSEKAEVRASVAAYLEREGATDGGDYYLKVYLKPENVDAESEWVVVRFTRYTEQRVAVASSYPYDSLMYSPYYAYDIYPYGYGCVTRISFQYYVDPFYHQHYYYPYYAHRGHKGGHHNDTADHRGGRPGGPGGNHGPGNPPPSGPVANNPPADTNRNPTYPRQSPPAGGGKPHYEDIQPGKHWRGRPGVDGGGQDVANNGDRPAQTTVDTGANPPSPNPNPANTGNRPARPASGHRNYNPTPQGYGSTNSTGTTNRPSGNRPSQGRHHNSNPNPNPAPTGVNNAPRTADRVTPTPDRSQQTYRPTPSSYRPTSPPVRQAPPSSQPAPARTYGPAPAPAPRVAPPTNNSDRQGSDSKRESLR